MRRSLRQTQQRSSRLSNVPPTEFSDAETGEVAATSKNPKLRKRRVPLMQNDKSNSEDEEYQVSDLDSSKKKRKVALRSKIAHKNVNAQLYRRLFGMDKEVPDMPPCQLPQRIHNLDYHRPLLLDNPQGRASLLEWFDGVSSLRSMPWRKSWVDPRVNAKNPTELRQKLERRAYEVWISEIMLQQTRVAVVIDYWNRWMEKWPTIHELATAEPDDVLAAWRGLGYYSRATRIHDAAKLVCEDPVMDGLLPSDVDELIAKVPGVGRYTAGAISAIVFGKAAPMVDGNVLRVLSRQLGIFGDVKTEKAVIDLLWAAADSLVKAVAYDLSDEETSSTPEEQISDRPGRWGQALMELGSTVCTPKPDCESCPIRASCRAYSEGFQLVTRTELGPKDMLTVSGSNSTRDIEDACNFCRPFEEVTQNSNDGDIEMTIALKKSTPRNKAKPRLQGQTTLSAFFTQSSEPDETTKPVPAKLTPTLLATIVDHARKFPVKIVKKAVKEQETLVCAIRRDNGKYLIHRRPQKGLLAGLWEFPSWIVPETDQNTATAYKRAAELYASSVLDPSLKPKSLTHPQLKCVGQLGSVPWLFSHLKLTMHVFLFELECSAAEIGHLPKTNGRWSDSVEEESMGTGMRKCWDLVRKANGD
ncbi:DNA glycosylase [Xylariaceae sp. FL1651]|nr:DNA glycosylase [Xylariaceae sp. FL1651]